MGVNKGILLGGAVLLPALIGCGSAAAQSNPVAIEEVVVTAQKREQNLQETPLSVVSISGDDLLDSGAATGDRFIQQALQGVAGVTVQNEYITVRGINANTYTNATFAPATASYVDGVFSPLGGGGSGAFLASATGFGVTGGNLDTQRVEVLRGPQGTLFGRSATGGVVNVITNDPSDVFEFKGVVEVGNHDLAHFGAVLNLPVVDGFALRAAVDSVDRDGYLSNGQDDNHDLQVRLKALYKSDRFSIMAAGFYEEFGDGYGGGRVPAFASRPAPGAEYVAASPTALKNGPSTTWMVYGRIELDLGFATATYVPEYGKQKTPLRNRTGFGLNLADIGDVWSTYHEFRLASQPGQKLIWIVGANYYKLHSVTSFTATTPTGVLVLRDENDAINKSYGVFGQATYPVTDALRITAGVRYSEETIDQHRFGSNPPFAPPPVGGPFDFFYSPKFESVDYRVAADYDLTPDNLLYASVSTGFRPGGISAAGGRTFEDERLTAYEIGSKNLFLDRRLQLNLAAFYYDYPSLQAGFAVFAGSTPVDTIVTSNPAEYKGGEVEGVYKFAENTTGRLSLSYLSAKFTSLDPVSLAGFGGYRIASSPKWTITGGVDQRIPLGDLGELNLSATATYRDTSYVIQVLNPSTRQRAYTLLDLSATYVPPGDRVRVTAYVRNATDIYYKTGGVSTATGGGELSVGAPRTYGVVLGFKF